MLWIVFPCILIQGLNATWVSAKAQADQLVWSLQGEGITTGAAGIQGDRKTTFGRHLNLSA